jgi:hypothetical protein
MPKELLSRGFVPEYSLYAHMSMDNMRDYGVTDGVAVAPRAAGVTDAAPPTCELSLPFPPIVRSSVTLMITTAVAAITNATRPLRRDEDIRTLVLFDYTATSNRSP